MATEILMPKLGLTMTEGLIDSWLVKEGDQVTAGQVILEISSEKLTNGVEAPADGVILKILHKEGETIPCKQPVGYIGAQGEAVPGLEGQEQQAPAEEEKQEQVSAPIENVQIERKAGERIFITPLARKIAKEKGYDIALINGTGGNGRITRRDVENYVPTVSKVEEPKVEVAYAAKANYGAGLTGMRQTIAKRMMESLQGSAQVTIHRKADLTPLLRFRKDMKSKVNSPLENGEIGITTLLTKAVTKALKDHPNMNAWYGGVSYEEQQEIHIGIATALSDGLVVPVVRNADKLSLSELGKTIKQQASDARKGTLNPSLYSGSTFSITNLGGPGVEYFTPILNTPEVGILGVGATQKQLAFNEEGEVVEKSYMPLSLTFDHTVIDGLPAAEFLATLIEYLEDPYGLVF